MRIQHNIMAMNAYRNYSTNTSALSKNLEKLSSGYKINRAGDDAAGLAISEKMRAQITGLEGAQKNAKDGISLVQTAEGALTEVHDMLNRMYSLAEQSANGTYENETDRAQLQKEVTQLKTEINRIADSANFNGIKLLDGSMEIGNDVATITGTVNGVTITGAPVAATSSVFTSGALTQTGTTGGSIATITINYTDANGATKSKDVSFQTGANASATLGNLKAALDKDSDLKDVFTAAVTGTSFTMTAKTGYETATVTSIEVKTATDDAVAIAEGQVTTKGTPKGTSYNMSAAFKDGDTVTIGNKTYTYAKDADGSDGTTFKDLNSLAVAAAKNGVTLDVGTNTAVKVVSGGSSKGLTLQIGDTSESFNQLTVSIDDCHTYALGIDDLDIGTQAGAQAALNTIKDAINYVSNVRGTLGATQNRLDHTINNLSVMQENIQDAESTIRDTDIADEMMSYTKNNILIQSAQAMLAQANQVPQGVLQLLQ